MCQFGQLIRMKIVETVVHLPPDLIFYSYNLMHQIRFWMGLRSRPHWATGRAYSAPQTSYLEGKGRGEKGKGRGGNEKGKGGRPLPSPSQFARPLGQSSPSRRPRLWVT